MFYTNEEKRIDNNMQNKLLHTEIMVQSKTEISCTLKIFDAKHIDKTTKIENSTIWIKAVKRDENMLQTKKSHIMPLWKQNKNGGNNWISYG